jgi:hypothetical protein
MLIPKLSNRRLHQHAADLEERRNLLAVERSQPTRRVRHRREQRLDAASVAAFIGPRDEQRRGGMRTAHDRERVGQKVEPFDRMEPSKKRHHLVAFANRGTLAKRGDRV